MFRKLIDLCFWCKYYIKFRFFLSRNKKELNDFRDEKKYSYVIVLEPWKYTAVPWFSITLGILLFRKKAHIKFIINDLPFERRIDYIVQTLAIKSIARHLPAFFSYDILSENKSESIFDDSNEEITKELHQLAFANAVHRNRGEQEGAKFEKEISRYFKLYKQNYKTLEDCVRRQHSDCFIIPGGIFGYSGLFSYLVKKNNGKYFTYDSGIGVLLTCFDGVAAQIKDIPHTLHLILDEQNEEEIEYAKKTAYDEYDRRINGTDAFKTQYSSIEESIHFDNIGFLIPLNSPWDSAMLKIDYLFNSYREWVIELVGIILENTQENITLRQHPDERTILGSSSLDFGRILKDRYENNPRIQYISCEDKVNTYSLFPGAKGVICFSSTLGIEAALAGKKVIVCSDVYYSELDFVIKPIDKTELVKIIKEVDSIVPLSEKEKDTAIMTYYIGQRCNWIYTLFTPSNSDFALWSKLNIKEIEELQEVPIILKSLEEKLPISYLIHKELSKKH